MPHSRRSWYQPCWVVGGVKAPPASTKPTPWATIARGRLAVSEESFWRREPAAALRGFTNALSPAATRASLKEANSATGKYTSPRISTRLGGAAVSRRAGIEAMVRAFAVMSSPTWPSPRVAARRRAPST